MTADDAIAGDLGNFFDAASVAVIGASADPAKLGHWPLRSMRRMAYAGRVTGVNPSAAPILDYPCVPDIASLPDDVRAAIVMLPPERAIEAVDACGRHGIRHVVVGASGFGETPAGKPLDARLLAVATAHDMRLCGPNTDGLANIGTGLALSFQPVLQSTFDLPRGGISIVSHSGAMISTICTTIVKAGGALSCTASCGNQLTLHMEDYLTWMATHDATRVVVLFIEAIHDADAMTAALRRCHDAGKHVVALKVGRSDAGQQAVTSHTGAIAGSYENTMSFLTARGVHCVDTLTELAALAVALSRIGAVGGTGSRVAVLSISGGLAGLAADMFEDAGQPLAAVSEGASDALAEITRATSPINPYDLAGHYSYDHVRSIIDVFHQDGYDTLMVALGLLPDPPRSGLLDAVHHETKQFLRTLVYAPHLEPDELAALAEAGAYVSADLPSVVSVASRGAAAWNAADAGSLGAPAPAAAELPGSGAVDEWHSKQYLAALGVATPHAVLVSRASDGSVDAGRAGAEFGDGPVVVKGVAAVAHKSELGLVRVGVRGADAIRDAVTELAAAARAVDPSSAGVLVEQLVQDGFEVIVGATRDATFGPVLVVGVGGVYVELIRSTAVLATPFTAEYARAAVAGTQVGSVLRGYRGRSYDEEALLDVLVRVQAAMLAEPRIESLEINPLFVLPRGAVAGDAKIVVTAAAATGSEG